MLMDDIARNSFLKNFIPYIGITTSIPMNEFMSPATQYCSLRYLLKNHGKKAKERFLKKDVEPKVFYGATESQLFSGLINHYGDIQSMGGVWTVFVNSLLAKKC